MRHAPPVSVLCHGRLWRRAQAAVWALTGAAFSAWVASHLALGAEGSAWVPWAALFTFVPALALSLRWIAVHRLELRWDGRQWLADREPCAVELMVHARRFVLLRLRTPAALRWVVVGRREAGTGWHGLLVALHGRTPAVDGWTEGQAG